MYPHIGFVLSCDIIPKPFVSAFVNDDEIPIQAHSCSWQIPAIVAILIAVSIRYITLVLHS